jgi:hypothetical protein
MASGAGKGDVQDCRIGTYRDRSGRLRDVRIERVDPRVVEALRRMTPGERIEAGLRHSDLLRESARALIEHQHPEWSREQVRDELFRRMHGADR